jgi:hypothetical protein
MSALPDIIEKVGFPFHWREEEVWALDAPAEDMDIGRLAWHFDVPFWHSPGGSYDLSPGEVMRDMDGFPEHGKRIESADISYPLDILKNPKTGRWTLLDGLHRLARLHMLGRKTVRVRKISMERIRSTPSYAAR